MAMATLDLSKKQFVNFKYKKTELTEVSKTKVKAIIEHIRNAKNIRIEVTTHTDSIGSNKYNQGLSDRRASAMFELLTDAGLEAGIIKTVGMGEKEPIADNATKAGQAINRRGEFVFKARGIEQ